MKLFIIKYNHDFIYVCIYMALLYNVICNVKFKLIKNLKRLKIQFLSLTRHISCAPQLRVTSSCHIGQCKYIEHFHHFKKSE